MSKHEHKPLDGLIHELSKLPGIGEKTAQRLSYFILEEDLQEVEKLANAIVRAKKETKMCSSCMNYSDDDICPICRSPHRDHHTICVVEQPKDIQAMERSGKYHGVYHVLHGTIVPQRGVTPGDIKIKELFERLKREDVQEIIIATNPTSDGETTALYLAEQLRKLPLKVTRIAYGIPVGGDLGYYDDLTIATALQHRVNYGPVKQDQDRENHRE